MSLTPSTREDGTSSQPLEFRFVARVNTREARASAGLGVIRELFVYILLTVQAFEVQ